MLARRVGFTVVEALVVAGIISVLLGILLPAVMVVREASNRTRCDNNFHQIGLAIHNFADTYKSLPRAFGAFPDHISGPAPPNAMYGSVFFMILPMMGEQALFDSSFDPGNGGLYGYSRIPGREVKSYLCPSDSTQDRAGLGNYVVNESLFSRMEKPKYRIDNIPDGAAQTIVCSERLSRNLDNLGNEAVLEWAGPAAYYHLESGWPQQRRGFVVGNNLGASSSHANQPALTGDGAVRRIAFGSIQIPWIRASIPDDGFGWEF